MKPRRGLRVYQPEHIDPPWSLSAFFNHVLLGLTASPCIHLTHSPSHSSTRHPASQTRILSLLTATFCLSTHLSPICLSTHIHASIQMFKWSSCPHLHIHLQLMHLSISFFPHLPIHSCNQTFILSFPLL